MSDFEGWYILDKDNEPKAASTEDYLRWCQEFPTRKIIGKTTINDQNVSTVFLGLDHSYGGGSLVLWETMIFGGEYDQNQWRHTSQREARESHERIVKNLVNSISPCEVGNDES